VSAHECDVAPPAVHVRYLVGCRASEHAAVTPLAQGRRLGRSPCMARLSVLHTEHCTLDAPRMYMSSVRHPPHSSCAISVPAGGTGVTPLQSAQRTFAAPFQSVS
jgi:hypothetical protein